MHFYVQSYGMTQSTYVVTSKVNLPILPYLNYYMNLKLIPTFIVCTFELWNRWDGFDKEQSAFVG